MKKEKGREFSFWDDGGALLYSQHAGGRGRRISELEANLVYRASSRTAKTIQRNPVSKTTKTLTNVRFCDHVNVKRKVKTVGQGQHVFESQSPDRYLAVT